MSLLSQYGVMLNAVAATAAALISGLEACKRLQAVALPKRECTCHNK